MIVPLLTLGMAGCASPDDPSASAPDESPAAEETKSDTTAAQELDSSASGWFAGLEITLDGSDYDPDAGLVTIHTSTVNTANTDFDFVQVYEDLTLDTGSGAPAEFGSASSVAVKLSTTDIDLTFPIGDEGVDLEKAVLQLGNVDQRRWLVPLDPDADGTGTEPEDLPITGTIDRAGFHIEVTKVQRVPWTCESTVLGTEPVLYPAPVADDKVGVIVWMDYIDTVDYRGGNTFTAVSIVGPDGTTTPADSGTVVLDLNGSIDDDPFCFTLD